MNSVLSVIKKKYFTLQTDKNNTAVLVVNSITLHKGANFSEKHAAATVYLEKCCESLKCLTHRRSIFCTMAFLFCSLLP